MTLLLGGIADDFTGATDLANTLVRQGMRTIQTVGIPEEGFTLPEADAVVVALKSRTTPAKEAVSESLVAYSWLKERGARQIFFKYCSTFDSTDAGNIGPVADALLEAMGEDFTIACPAFPAAGRRVFHGHLFVGDVLLSDSGMRNHPLTPMRDSNLVKVLGRQTSHKVGLVRYEAVDAGAEITGAAFEKLQGEGCRYAIVDAVSDRHLMTIGAACNGLGLVTGGSGVALGLPENFRCQGLLGPPAAVEAPQSSGRAIILAGSCSEATLAQVARARKQWSSYLIDPLAVAGIGEAVAEAVAWAQKQDAGQPILFYSSQEPEKIRAIQETLGRDDAGDLVEQIHAGIARSLAAQGAGKIIVAGGETSGAVVQALDVKALEIGPEIDPGVPWTKTVGDSQIALALKSGNFGAEDFFSKALGMLT